VKRRRVGFGEKIEFRRRRGGRQLRSVGGESPLCEHRDST
jgi:hypothetical protein